MKIVRRGLEITHVSPAGRIAAVQTDLLGQVTTIPHSGSSLRIVAFSDWRVQDIRELIASSRPRKRGPTSFYTRATTFKRFRPAGRNLFQQIGKLSANGLCAVAGNDDPPACRDLIAGSMYTRCTLCPRAWAVCGCGRGRGASLSKRHGTPQYGHLPYPERVLALR